MPNSNNTAPLLERAFLFLEDGEWERADDFCEQVLNMEPKNAQAYLGKLMAQLKVRKQEDLKNLPRAFLDNNNCQKIFRFGDEELKATLTGYIDYINTRNKNARLGMAYISAKKAMEAAKTSKAFGKAAAQFEALGGYKDAAQKLEACRKNMDELAEQEMQKKLKTRKKIKILIPVVAVVILAVLAVFLFCTEDQVDLWVLENVYVECEGEEILARYCTYDEQGNMIEFGDRLTYVLTGGPFNTTEYTYDENGDCVRKFDNNEYFRNKGINVDPLTTKYSYTYEDGKKTEKYEKTEDGKHLVEKYYYNDDKLSKIVYYDSEEEEYARKTFDEYGRVTEITVDFKQEKYFYDDNGRLEKIKCCYADLSRDFTGEYVPAGTFVLYYDSEGHLEEAECSSDSGKSETYYFETDEYGNIIEGNYFSAVPQFYEYKKIRVSREQARKLIAENATLLMNTYIGRDMQIYYRIEE